MSQGRSLWSPTRIMLSGILRALRP